MTDRAERIQTERDHAAALDGMGLKVLGDVHRSEAAKIDAGVAVEWRCSMCGNELTEGVGCCGLTFAEVAEPEHV